MPPTFSPQQIDRLGKEIARVFVLDDFGVVLGRYPGQGEPSTFLPADAGARPMVFVTSTCLQEIDKEGTLMPFLSRVVEHKWQREDFRSAIFSQARELVRDTSDAAPHIALIIAALKALTPELAIDANAGNCHGPQTCRVVRGHRAELATIVETLDQFEALKVLHDSLHVLQVKGTDWLDPSDPTPDLPLEALQAIVEGVRAAAAGVRQRVPPESAAVCERCRDTAADAHSGLGGDDDRREFALAQLRRLLIEVPPQLDERMFTLSRDLPIKRLRGLLESATDAGLPVAGQMNAAIAALDALSDTMRAHILEHALWQATEHRIRTIAQLLAHPGPGFLDELVDQWGPVRQNLQTLVDSPTGVGVPMIGAVFNSTIALYEGSLPTPGLPPPSGPPPEQRFAAMVEAFNEFRPKTYLHFLAVDQALKTVFTSLLPLRAALDGLRARVPRICVCPP
jgi:hypothetical protein